MISMTQLQKPPFLLKYYFIKSFLYHPVTLRDKYRKESILGRLKKKDVNFYIIHYYMSIRFVAILSCLLISINSPSLGQSSNEDITRIRQTFSKINTDPHLKMVVLEAEDFLDQSPDGGASLTGYFSKGDLVKITEWIGLSYGIRQTDFYYDSANLIFCFVSEKHFQTTKTEVDYTKTTLVFEGRYYYKNDNLIQKKRTGSGFWDKTNEATIIPDSKVYSKLLIKKRDKVN